MCADCQAARGLGGGPYPVMTRAQMCAGLDLLPTWALEQKAAAFSVPTTVANDFSTTRSLPVVISVWRGLSHFSTVTVVWQIAVLPAGSSA
jgi:hypothetical protein